MPSSQIMLVEDERIVAMHLRQQLLKLGYHVPAVVASGAHALRQIEASRPDLILMDIHIEGDMDGIATAAAIPLDYYIPVIYLTAFSEEATLVRARATRPYGYLIKPFSERELHATIQMTLERRAAEAALRITEERLRQSQKMEAVGQLAGGVAHDFNNLLALIYGYLDEMQDCADGDEILKGLIAETYEAARRGATLTRQLLAYSRRQPLSPRVVTLTDLITNLTGLLRRTLGEAIEIQLNLRPKLHQTYLDPNQLENALLNLALNARDAMPSGGRLTIEAENVVLDEDYIDEKAEAVSGHHVLLTLTDTGTGMPKSVIDRIFEPFFTTKPPGKGSGLGLSMVYGFVMQSSGHIKIYSEPGHGTSIRIFLRAADDDFTALPSANDMTALARPKADEVVLVVEDDDSVRRLIVRTLRHLGYQTLEASHGRAAMQRQEEAARIDLLLTDLVLPDDMSGVVLARQLRAIQPGLKVIYMSGYAAEAVAQSGALDPDVKLLNKPFRRSELARALRNVLG
jgi:signal transduction histidine kinase